MSKYVYSVVAMLLGLLYHASSFSQIRAIDDTIPALTVSLSGSHIDNFNPTLTDSLSSSGVQVSAFGALLSKGEGYYVGLDYAASEQVNFTQSSEENFDGDQNFTHANASIYSRLFITNNLAFDASLSHSHVDQPFGQGLSRFRNNVLTTDTLNSTQLGGTLIYGKETAKRYITFGVRAREDRFENNNVYSTLFNLSQQVAELNLLFRRSAMGLAFKFDITNDDFEQDSRIDSVMYRALVGLDWQATGKSKLRALIGQFWRNVERGNNDSGLSWQIDYEHSPREDIKLTVSSARISQESELEFATNSIIETYVAGLAYQYSSQWSYAVNTNFRTTEFVATEDIGGLDEFIANAYVEAQIKDHSRMRLQYAFQDVNNQDNSIDYQQNEVRLTWFYAF